MYNILRKKCNGLRLDAISLTQDLVRIPSVSLEESAVADRVEFAMNDLGYDHVHRDSAGNVIGIIQGRENDPSVLLSSHMDTIALNGQRREWRHDPFGGSIEGDRLYGLGAADCKGGLVAQICAGALLKRSLLPLKGNLIVAATVAEENGCSVGMRVLLEQTLPELDLHPTFVILGEPTSGGLYYGHDGWVQLEIHLESRSLRHLDDTARMIRADFETDNQVLEMSDRIEKGQSPWLDQPNPDERLQARPSFLPTESKPAFVQIDAPRFENNGETCHLTLSLSKRLNLTETLPGVLNQLQRYVSLVAQQSGALFIGASVRLENQTLYTGRTAIVRRVTDAWMSDPFHPLIEKTRMTLLAASCPAKPGRWQLNRLGMGTAGSLLVNEYHLPTIGFGPGDEMLAHAPDEYVELDNLDGVIYGTAAAAHGIIGIPVYGWSSEEF